MCRWSAYSGEPIPFEEIIRHPGYASVEDGPDQMLDRLLINTTGFGAAWYGAKPEPDTFRMNPSAASHATLDSATAAMRSDLFLAHICTPTSGPTNRNDCHPFVHGRWSFMLNGQIGRHEGLSPDAGKLVPKTLLPFRQGGTGTEALFLTAVAEGLDDDPRGALERAVARFLLLVRSRGERSHLRMTAALSDGQRLYAVRYAPAHDAPPLYHRWSKTHQGRHVVSLPGGLDLAAWEEVPECSFCTFDGNKVEVEDFLPYGLAAAA